MTHYDIFNYKGVSESREVARGPKDPPPGVIGLMLFEVLIYSGDSSDGHTPSTMIHFKLGQRLGEFCEIYIIIYVNR